MQRIGMTQVRAAAAPAPAGPQFSPWLRAGFRLASAVAPGAAAMLARRAFFTPPRARVRDEERAVLARGEPFFLDVGGARIVGRAWGEGPTVLLAHGWGGHSGHMTPMVDPIVAAGYRAVAIDTPGHGESEGRLSSLVHFASALDRVSALFTPLGGLVAHSFGAAAATLAMSRGLAVRRAVFFAPFVRFQSVWAQFRAGLGVSEEIWTRMVREAEQWLEVRFDAIAPSELAPHMTTPLLVLHDVEDREVTFADGAELVSRWPGATLHQVEQLGHFRLLRDPACVAEAVRFLGGGCTEGAATWVAHRLTRHTD